MRGSATRLLAAAIALLAVWLCLPQPEADAAQVVHPIATYSYAAHRDAAAIVDGQLERGSPTTCTNARNAYDHLARFAEFAGGSRIVTERAGEHAEGPAVVPRSSVAAKTGATGFGALTKAGDYGVWPCRTPKADLKGTGFEAHHLIEERFAGVIGQSPGDMASVAVTDAEHQAFLNAWRQAIPYGEGTANAAPAEIRNAASQIYADYPDIRSARGLP